ncbi:MAG: hypothetical protein KUG74_14280 [Rhodobacteraceae bacterium]|nr:hypothetical protein [Paracoccaceae bacterium]
MTYPKSNHIALAEYFCSRETIPLLSVLALKLAYQTTIWSVRSKTRKELGKMDSYRLADVGMTAKEAFSESRKPFWRA